MTQESARLRDLGLLRRVRDRIDREYAQPLDVEALARGAHMSAGHEQLQAAGVEVVQEPIDQDYGLRDCAVRDPAGNLVRIQQT